ncbi:hypothetical protein Syun_014972 [Stephania yunnanensis]|uniref:Uncharacterized protein n=1 Tax=Stephania yunnanensis TaxID=152371 RepID=A0AAP0JKH3_9MAGN
MDQGGWVRIRSPSPIRAHSVWPRWFELATKEDISGLLHMCSLSKEDEDEVEITKEHTVEEVEAGNLRLIRSCLLRSCIMSSQGGNSYHLREIACRDKRNWHAQMEHRITVMAETYQKNIHDMRSTQNQRLADLAQSHEMNMARILELMQQGNTGTAERAPVRHRPNSPLTLIHKDHLVEEGADFATAVAAMAVPVWFEWEEHQEGSGIAAAPPMGGGDDVMAIAAADDNRSGPRG